MKKRAFLCALTLLLVLTGCGGGKDDPDIPKAPAPEARLEVPLRFYDEMTGTILELPQIVGEDNAAVKEINAELKGWYTELEAYYSAEYEEYFWGEVRAYPTENDRFLNAVVTFCEYPVYGTCGEVYSWVYNKNTKQRLTLESAFAEAGIDAETLLADFTDWCAADGQVVLGIDTIAFRMLEDGTPQFIAGVMVEGPYEGENWISFFTWTEGQVDWPYHLPMDPAEVNGTFADGPLTCQGGTAAVPGESEEAGEVWLSWTSSAEGDWPFTQTLETLEFCGDLNAALEDANASLRMDAENAKGYFEECKVMGEAACYENGGSWADLWAYPVTTDRYLSAVTVRQENMHFRVEGSTMPWNMVSSIVYDKEEQRIVSLEDAFVMADVDQGRLEGELMAFTRQQNIGIYEDLSSLAFYMAEDDEPVFMIGAIVDIPWGRVPWTTFFTWDGGEIAWPHDHPMPLGIVDTMQDGLSCLAGMGQYDGAAMISEEEAFDVLTEIYDVQSYIAQGMSMVSYGTTEYLDGEDHLLIELGTEYGNSFDTEFIYAVSWGSVYQLDGLNGEWIPVGFG